MKKLLFSTLSVILLFIACSKEEQAPPPPPTPTYTLSFSAEAGGSVSSEGGTYNEGSKITITATPDAQYLFKEWSDGSTTNPREITVTSNLTLSATFVKKTYPLAVTIEGEGTVQEEVIIQGSTSETNYNAGTTVRLTATPNEGWVFTGWSGDVESEDSVIEVPIEKGMSVTATFMITSFTISLGTSGGGRVVNYNDVVSKTYNYGDTITLIAEANFGSEFVEWSEGLSPTKIQNQIVVDGDKDINASFREAPFRLGIQNYEGGSSRIIRENGSSNINFSSGSKATLLAIPDDGYKFHSWFGGVNSTENPVDITITDSLELRATFYKSDLDITISAINYEHKEDYPIDQLISTIENISGTTGLYTAQPRVLFAGHISSSRILDDYRSSFNPTLTIEMQKDNSGIWSIINEYPLEIWGPRNTKVKGNNVLVLDGMEIGPSPEFWEGNMYLGKIGESSIQWEKVTSNEHMGYFHSGSFGDFNGDGNFDVVGVSGTPPDGSESFFISNSNGVFELLQHQTQEDVISTDFSAELYDLDGDGKDEIILPKASGDIQILKYNATSNSFYLAKQVSSTSINMGPTSTRLADFNNDGYIDISIARESGESHEQGGGNSFEVWLGEDEMNFRQVFFKRFNYDELAFREFTLLDANNDGFMDIILNGQGGSLPDTRTQVQGRTYTETNFKHFVWLNNGSADFAMPDKDFIVNNSEIIYLVPYLDNGMLHFMGPNHFNTYGTMDVDYQKNTVGFKIWDISIPLN